jgi:hypothetical protein
MKTLSQSSFPVWAMVTVTNKSTQEVSMTLSH